MSITTGIGTYVPIDAPKLGHYISGGLDQWKAGIGIVENIFNNVLGYMDSIPGLGWVIKNLVDFSHIDEGLSAIGIAGDVLGWSSDAIYPIEQYLTDPIFRQIAWSLTGYHAFTEEERYAMNNAFGSFGPSIDVNDRLGQIQRDMQVGSGSGSGFGVPSNIYVSLDTDAINAGFTPVPLAIG